MKVSFKYPCGIEVECQTTKFRGIITSRLQMINGCIQYCVQPPCKKGEQDKIPDSLFLDEQYLKPFKTKIGQPQEVEFKFNLGDKIKNLMNGATGIVRYCIQDQNGCMRYEAIGDIVKETGKALYIQGFEQEMEKVSDGINKPATKTKPAEERIPRANTGGPSRRASMYERN
jgi:hypothetical protein